MKRPFLPLVPVAVLLAPGLAACGEQYHAEKNWTPLASTGKPDPDRSAHPEGRAWRAVIPEGLAIELIGEDAWRRCQELLAKEGARGCNESTADRTLRVEIKPDRPPVLVVDPRTVRPRLDGMVVVGRGDAETWLHVDGLGLGTIPDAPQDPDEARRGKEKAKEAARARREAVARDAAAGAPENASEAAPTEPRPSEDAGETPTEAGPPSRDDANSRPDDG